MLRKIRSIIQEILCFALPYIKELPIICLGDSQDTSLEEQIESNHEFKKLLEALKDPKSSQAALIIVHCNQNHWITFTINKQGPSIQYIVADSAGGDICKQPEVEVLINSIKKVVPKNCSSSYIRPPQSRCNSPSKFINDSDTSSRNSQDILNDKSNYATLRSSFKFKNPKLKMSSLGGEIPKDITLITDKLSGFEEGYKSGLLKTLKPYIFYGYPGSGKSTFAEAIAGDTGRLFIRGSCAEITGSYINHTADAVRALFESARDQTQPIVICLDEIDTLISTGCQDNNGEYLKARAAFNQQLDIKDLNVLLIGTTNNYDSFSDALKSRFTAVKIDLPDNNQRVKILNHILADRRHDLIEQDITYFAQYTKNWNVRNLEDLVELAGILRFQEIKESKDSNLPKLITKADMDKAQKAIQDKLNEFGSSWFWSRDPQLWLDNAYKGSKVADTILNMCSGVKKPPEVKAAEDIVSKARSQIIQETFKLKQQSN